MTDPANSNVLHSVEHGIARIVINRPEAANALQPAHRAIIIRLLEEAGLDPAVRVVVISANGKQFCSGADVGGIAGPNRAGQGMLRIMNAGLLVAAVLDCAKPVIGAIQGVAAGLGAHLAFACDLVIAAEEASFIEVFVKRGLTVDAAGAYLLPRLIGVQKAKELVFFGDRLAARDALTMGLVNRVVAATELSSTVDAFAARLASGPTTAISLAKRQINRSLDIDRATAFLEEGMAQEINSKSDDAAEGVQAFMERREPVFKGY